MLVLYMEKWKHWNVSDALSRIKRMEKKIYMEI